MAGIAAHRPDNHTQFKVIDNGCFTFWRNQCDTKKGYTTFTQWGSFQDYSVRMILFNDDPVKFGKGRHWVLFVCDPVTITLTLLNSGTTTLETQQAIEFLEGWLRAEVYLQKPTRQIITSNA